MIQKYAINYKLVIEAGFVIEAESLRDAREIGERLLDSDFAENINERLADNEWMADIEFDYEDNADQRENLDLTADEIHDLIGE